MGTLLEDTLVKSCEDTLMETLRRKWCYGDILGRYPIENALMETFLAKKILWSRPFDGYTLVKTVLWGDTLGMYLCDGTLMETVWQARSFGDALERCLCEDTYGNQTLFLGAALGRYPYEDSLGGLLSNESLWSTGEGCRCGSVRRRWNTQVPKLSSDNWGNNPICVCVIVRV